MWRFLSNVFHLGRKELASLRHDLVMVVLIVYGFTGMVYVPAVGTGIEVRNATVAVVPDFGNNRSTYITDNDGKLSVYFLDVGQGDSTLVLFSNTSLLIDAGEADICDRVVSDLKTLGVRRIDLLVATHPHSDHIGGMQEVLAAFPVGQVLDSGIPHTSSTYEHFLETIEQKKIPYRVAEQGQTIYIDPSLTIFVLSPPKEHFGDDLNTNSIVLRISYGTVAILVAGDIRKSSNWRRLLIPVNPSKQERRSNI